MQERKRIYELTAESKENSKGIKLFRIRCIKETGDIKVGDLGGWISDYDRVFDNAWVGDNAEVWGNAQVYGNSRIYGNARVYGNVRVYGNAKVNEYVTIGENVHIFDNAWVGGYGLIVGHVHIFDNAQVSGHTCIFGNIKICGSAYVYQSAVIRGNAYIGGDVGLRAHSQIDGDAKILSDSDYCYFDSFGDDRKPITAFKTTSGDVNIFCDYLFKSIEEFQKMVEEKHGDTKYGREYKAIIEVMKIKFDLV